ncbi:MAG: DUF3857 domain-containing protein [Ginsengibacter sp.]
MLSKKNLCFLLLILLTHSNLTAQDKLDIKFGKVKAADFDITSTLIDSSTNAVVVADVGKSVFIANTSDLTFSLIFTEKKRIKIVNKNGYDAATITIPLYLNDHDKSEKLENLDAVTYNMENGKVVETRVEKSAIFTEKHSKNWTYKKFTFPALKEGSIIEYSYQVKSDFFFNLQSWTFQGEYPVLWSQYNAEIPDFFKYVTLAQGYQPFFINKVDRSQAHFSFVQHVERESSSFGPVTNPGLNNYTIDGSLDRHSWVMKNVPALKEEPFTTTLQNAIAKIEFQLNQVVFPNSMPQNYMDTWEKVASNLMADEDFGLPISRANNWLDDILIPIVANTASQKEKAQKIFEYVRDNFTCNDINGIYTTKGLKEVFRNKNGSVSDINMLLIAMLKSRKIDATPVILSTRDHGFANEYYPLLNRYNYLIAKVVIDETEWYLDATSRYLAYGTLPSLVYNGQAREIADNVATPVYFVADSLKESGTTNVYISNTDSGGVEGTFSHNFGVYESLRFRNTMTKTLPADFKKSLQQEYPEEIAIDNIEIDSLKLLNEPVGLQYDLKFKSFGDEDIVYFNPLVGEAIKKNPFTVAERFYPVEMPYSLDDIYNFTMEIPKGYTVDELPKSARVNVNENEGMFEYIISADKQYIQMRCKLVLKKATYLNEDYQTLRDFYTFIVKKEAEQIVFKKIK